MPLGRGLRRVRVPTGHGLARLGAGVAWVAGLVVVPHALQDDGRLVPARALTLLLTALVVAG